ncbi:unnamed protein product [Arctogadus glacialis]
MDNGMEQISPKNIDHGKTTTTSKIMDNGKTQQQTKNADIGVETTTRGIMDYGTGGDRADENQEGRRDGGATAVAVVLAEEAAEVSVVVVDADAVAAATATAAAEAEALAVAEAAALAVAAAAAAEMEPLCSTVDDVVLPEDPPTGGAIGLGVGGGTSGDLVPKMAHDSTLVGGGGPGGVGEDGAGGMFAGWEIEEAPEEERDQVRRSWMEEMDVEAVSEADEPMDRKERKAELLVKRKAKKERTVVAKKKGLRTRTSHCTQTKDRSRQCLAVELEHWRKREGMGLRIGQKREKDGRKSTGKS